MTARTIVEAETPPLGFTAQREDGDKIEYRYDPAAHGYRFTKWWNDAWTRKCEVLANIALTRKGFNISREAKEFEDAGWTVTWL